MTTNFDNIQTLKSREDCDKYSKSVSYETLVGGTTTICTDIKQTRRLSKDSADKPLIAIGTLTSLQRNSAKVMEKLFYRHSEPKDSLHRHPERSEGSIKTGTVMPDLIGHLSRIKKEAAEFLGSRLLSCPRMTERGRSMIEMLGVLAIIGVLSVGGIAGYSKAMLQYRINKTINHVTEAVNNTHILFMQQQGNYKYKGVGDSGCEVAESLGLIPADPNICEQWVGIFTQQEWEDDDNWQSNSKGFHIILSGLSNEECVKLATYDWGNRTTGLIGYSVGENMAADLDMNPYITYNCSGGENIEVHMWDTWNVSIACTGGSVVGVPMSPSVAARACADCDELELGCYMDFIFE